MRIAWRSLAVFFAILATGYLATTELPRLGGRALWMLPSGIAVAAMLRWGRKQWIAIGLGEVALELLRGRHLLPALAVGGSFSLGVVAIYLLLMHNAFDRAFSHRRDIPLFVAASLAGMLIPALVGALGLAISYPVDPLDSLRWGLVDVLRWWLNDVFGTLLLAPALIAANRESLATLRQHPWLSAAAACLLAAMVAYTVAPPEALILSGPVLEPVFALSALAVVVSSLQLGLVPTSIIAAVLSIANALSYSFGIGVYRGSAELPGLIGLWSYIAAMVGTTLVLATLLAEGRRAEESRRSAERLFRAVFDKASLPAVITNPPRFEFVRANEAFVQLFEFSAEELVGKTAFELGINRLPEARAQAVREFERHGVFRDYEQTFFTKSGRAVRVLANVSAADVGEKRYAIVSVQDVTERARLEDALRQEAEYNRRQAAELAEGKLQLRRILDGMPMFICLTSSDGLIVEANLAPLAMAGLDRRDTVGMRLPDTYPFAYSPEVQRRMRDALRAAALGETRRYDEVVRVAGDVRITVDIAVTPLRQDDGAINQILVSATDISERQRLEARSRVEAERNRSFLRSASDGVHILDDTGRVFEVSESFCELLGYSREELIGLDPSAWDQQSTRVAILDSVDRVVRGERHRFETRHRRKDGKVIDVEVFSNAFEIEGKRYVYCSARDLTEVKRLQREVIAAATHEQRRLGQEIHDGLGQVLSGTAMMIGAMGKRAALGERPDADALHRVEEHIGRCIATARGIVHGLSPLADVDGDLVVGLDALAKSRAELGQPLRFHASIEAPIALTAEDSSHLYRIAQEAVQNALKYANATRIDINLTSTPSELRLSVADDGSGIPRSENRGIGFGMYTMRYRATAIGGALEVRSAPGTGTIVSCSVPQPPSSGSVAKP